MGATAFSLLTGAHVHQGRTVHEVLVRSATETAPKLEKALPGTPAALCRVVNRALAFRKADRWPDATTMRDALAAAGESIRTGQQEEDDDEREDETRLALPAAVPRDPAAVVAQPTVRRSTIPPTARGTSAHSAVLAVAAGGLAAGVVLAIAALLLNGSPGRTPRAAAATTSPLPPPGGSSR